jgi:flagellin
MLRLNRSLERLSSGLRINRAADDAAGLAIAEGFRSSVLGFRVAQRNSQDAISMVQTAEGALSETTNMLQRIRELAVQAASGTSSDANRSTLQDEVEELIEQIDDIASDTEFNNINILDCRALVARTWRSTPGSPFRRRRRRRRRFNRWTLLWRR